MQTIAKHHDCASNRVVKGGGVPDNESRPCFVDTVADHGYSFMA